MIERNRIDEGLGLAREANAGPMPCLEIIRGVLRSFAAQRRHLWLAAVHGVGGADPHFRNDGRAQLSAIRRFIWRAPTSLTLWRSRWGFWPAILIAPLPVGLLGVVVERYFLRRVHRHGHAHELLVTFGLSLIIAEVVKLFYGNYPVDYHVPESLNFAAFHIFGSDYPAYRVFMGAISLVMFGLVYLLLTRTRAGIIVRSAIYKPRMAEALGHNVPLVFMGVFGVGAMLAGLAGAVAGAFYTTSPTMAWIPA